METIQIALSDAGFGQALRNKLASADFAPVQCVKHPDTSKGGIIVVDFHHLEMLPRPIEAAERVVLIAGDGPDDLDRAWSAGVQSVVSHTESIDTMVLAVLAACLQASQSPAARPWQVESQDWIS